LKTGTIVRKMGLDASHFGEGITILDDQLYQLTWKNQKCLV
jgi:glutamine cyclotransferase